MRVVILIILLVSCSSQYLRAGKRKRNRQVDGVIDGKLMKALTINYPLGVFDGSFRDWRKPGAFDSEFTKSIAKDSSWKEFSHAQDQEDIWLFENWFYGMKDGLIMESGALNGILFSTTFMFEHVANWTALHVGKLFL